MTRHDDARRLEAAALTGEPDARLRWTRRCLRRHDLAALQRLADVDPDYGRQIARALLEAGHEAAFEVAAAQPVVYPAWIDADTHDNLLRGDAAVARWLVSPLRVRLLWDDTRARSFGADCATRALAGYARLVDHVAADLLAPPALRALDPRPGASLAAARLVARTGVDAQARAHAHGEMAELHSQTRQRLGEALEALHLQREQLGGWRADCLPGLRLRFGLRALLCVVEACWWASSPHLDWAARHPASYARGVAQGLVKVAGARGYLEALIEGADEDTLAASWGAEARADEMAWQTQRLRTLMLGGGLAGACDDAG